MTCKINADTSDGLKIVSDTSGEIEIQDNGTTRLTVGDTIDIQGTELVLDADADTSMHASTDDQIDFKLGGSDRVVLSTTKIKLNSSGNAELELKAGATDSDNSLKYMNSAGSRRGFISYDTDNEFMFIGVNNAEKMRIQTTGNVLLGKTSESYGTDGWCIKQNGRMHSSVSVSDDNIALDKDGNGNFIYFSTATTQRGQISYDGSNVLYGSSSDYRLKENVDYSFDATTRLKQLKPCRFNWISDDTNTAIDGFLAHEVSDVVANAVYGTKDATKTSTKIVKDKDGAVIEADIEEADWTAGKSSGLYPSDSTWTASESKEEYQTLDPSKLVPLLVKTIQELEARITALES